MAKIIFVNQTLLDPTTPPKHVPPSLTQREGEHAMGVGWVRLGLVRLTMIRQTVIWRTVVVELAVGKQS